MSDWYVNGSVGASGAGTSAGTAFRTLAEGSAAASSGDTIHVAGGVYREVLAPPAGVTVLGDPDDWFVISGGEPLPGLAPCVPGDAAAVGDLWTSMWKATVPLTFFPGSDPLAGNLCEAGVQMPLSCERADRTDTFFLTKGSYYHTADSVELDGANITGFRLPAVTDLYTQAQLEGARIYFNVEPNASRQADLTFDVATDTLRPTGGPYVYEDNAERDNFALFNLPAAARPGEWGFTRSGTDVTLYVRPADGANVAAGLVEYSARAIGLRLDRAPDVEVSNFRVRQQGCPSKPDCPITIINGSDDPHLHNFSVSDTYSPGGGGYSQIFMRGDCDRPNFHDFELTRAQGQFGLFLFGTGAINADYPFLYSTTRGTIPFLPAVMTGATSGATVTVVSTFNVGSGIRFRFLPGGIAGTFLSGETLTMGGATVGAYSPSGSQLGYNADPTMVSYGSGGAIRDFSISYTSQSPFRVYTWQDLAVWHGVLAECGREAHANTANFYEQCHNVLFWGVDAQGADGYMTWQEGDGFVLAFCAFSASTASSGGQRAIAQQQNGHAVYPGEAFGHLPSAVLNCRTTPFPGRVADTRYGNGMVVTSANAPLNRWTVYNNIYQGHNGEQFVALDAWDHNVNTEPGGPGTGTNGPNDVVSSWALNYTDAEAGDFTYKPSAPVRSITGRDWSALIRDFETRWPQVPGAIFGTDMLGDAIDWSSPPVGPTVDLDAEYGVPRAIGAPGFPPPEAVAPPTLPDRFLRLSVRVA